MKEEQERDLENNISQKYRKWLCEAIYSENSRLFIWGNDMQSPNEDNFLLIDSNKKIITFKSKRDFDLSFKSLIVEMRDATNTLNWSEQLPEIKVENTFDFKILKDSVSKIFSSKDEVKKLIDVLNLISDYIDQTNALELKLAYNRNSIRMYFNYAYNNFFWRKKNPNQSKMSEKILNTGKSRSLVNLHELFKNSFDSSFS